MNLNLDNYQHFVDCITNEITIFINIFMVTAGQNIQ